MRTTNFRDRNSVESLPFERLCVREQALNVVQREAITATYLNSIYEPELIGSSQLSVSGIGVAESRISSVHNLIRRKKSGAGSLEGIVGIQVNHTEKVVRCIVFVLCSRYVFQ